MALHSMFSTVRTVHAMRTGSVAFKALSPHHLLRLSEVEALIQTPFLNGQVMQAKL